MKKTSRRVLALLLCVLMATSVAMTACTPEADPTKDSSTNPPTTAPTTKPTEAPDNAAELTFVLKTQYGIAVPGAKLVLEDDEKVPSAEPWICPREDCKTENAAGAHRCSSCSEVYTVKITYEAVTNAEGVAVFRLPDAGIYGTSRYTLLIEDLPENHVGGTSHYQLEEGEKKTVDISIIDNTPDGTLEHAYFVGADAVSKPFEAGQTIYFQAVGGVGRKIIIENAKAELSLLGQVYQPDENGVVSAYFTGMNAEGHVSFGIKNTAADAQELTVRIDSDPGTSDNPLSIAPGSQIVTAEIPAGRDHYYRWVATEDGSVTAGPVNVALGTMSLVCNRTVIGEDGKEVTTSIASVSTNAEGVNTVTMDYKAGDVIIVRVSATGGGDASIDFIFDYTPDEPTDNN